jgi:hypothetical protein
MADIHSRAIVGMACALDSGILPFSGGFAEQPGRCMALIGVAQREMRLLEDARARKQAAQR